MAKLVDGVRQIDRSPSSTRPTGTSFPLQRRQTTTSVS